MNYQQITLQLPNDLYERVKKVAEHNNLPLEAVLLESLDLLFAESAELDTRLTSMEHLSDEQLWEIVNRRLIGAESERLHELNEGNKQATLAAEEQRELEQFLERIDRDLVLRSEALRLLRARGYAVERFFAPTP